MSRRLLIMRHAKSAWDTDVPSDFDRPLAKRGLRDAPRMGLWLKKQRLIPDYVVSSPAERAKQTTLLVSKALEIRRKKIIWDPRIYGAGSEDLLEVLAEIPKKAKLVLVVGHNPGLEYLVSHLVGQTAGEVSEIDSEGGLVRTATIVHLELPDDWNDLAPGCATLVAVQGPRELPE